jgi:trimethylamine--corrinoid protein Co-methyltransferase
MIKMNSDKNKDRMPYLSPEQMERIHGASLQILERVGVCFHHEGVTDTLAKKGFRISQGAVLFKESQILKALETCPAEFTVHAPSMDHNVRIGREQFVLLPAGGATSIMGEDGSLRPAVMEDYRTCCKLVQTSFQLDLAGFMMVYPGDIPTETAHLEMLLENLLLCDKSFVAATTSGRAARDNLDMARFIRGGRDRLSEKPMMVAIITAASPLQYAGDQTECIVRYAESGQPIVLITMPLAGSSGPVDLAALMAQINAEILAGTVLVQILKPGTPVVYGSIAAPVDMKSMNPAVGATEVVQLAMMTAQMAGFYGMPCRAGGSLTDSQVADYQAATESTLLMSTVLRAGAHFIFQSCGLLASCASMSFAKWLLDEEMCSHVRRILQPLKISPKEEIDISSIEEVGIGGLFLTHESTFKDFRDLSQPVLFNRRGHRKWLQEGGLTAEQAALKALPERLDSYCRPPMDQGLEQELREWVNNKKAGFNK